MILTKKTMLPIIVFLLFGFGRNDLANEIIIENYKILISVGFVTALFFHAPFETFKKYFEKIKIPINHIFFISLSAINHNITDPELLWVINHKKMDTLIDEQMVSKLDTFDLRQEIIDLLNTKENFVKIITQHGYLKLFPKIAKDIFIF